MWISCLDCNEVKGVQDKNAASLVRQKASSQWMHFFSIVFVLHLQALRRHAPLLRIALQSAVPLKAGRTSSCPAKLHILPITEINRFSNLKSSVLVGRANENMRPKFLDQHPSRCRISTINQANIEKSKPQVITLCPQKSLFRYFPSITNDEVASTKPALDCYNAMHLHSIQQLPPHSTNCACSILRAHEERRLESTDASPQLGRMYEITFDHQLIEFHQLYFLAQFLIKLL